MQLRRLGKQGPELSVIGYGAWEIGGEAYGPNPSDSEVVRVVHAVLEGGVNWIDTAEIYGRGRSEALVGKAIEGRRAEVLVATKVAPRPVGTGFRPREVRKALGDSLRRLRVDQVDLYQLHWWPEEEACPIEETWGTMSELVDEGLVRHIGVSNFDRDQIERCLAVRHVDSLQPQYSMLHRKGEDLFRWCAEKGIGVVVYGPLAYGLLTGAITPRTEFAPEDWRGGRDPEHPYYRDLFAPGVIEGHLAAVERLEPIAARLALAPGQLALAWTFHQAGVTSAIAGSRNAEHSRENAAAGGAALTSADLEEIEAALS